ncbi:hypothetical protein LIER_22721 [Lithospermum erythrorhizon]|uniref:Integrase catalytic domain-containing protein n=1 Tax=Lithospermum erythrorhizon TaxID=34254 RepID=A0AAV3QYC0_LITER
MYYPQANGLAEAFNKILCNVLKKVVNKSKTDWHEKMEEALWAYKTTYRTPTQSTPYALVYSVEAVLPLESQIPSLRMAIQEGLTQEENVHLRLEELESLDERSLDAQQRDMVLSVRRPIITHNKGKKIVSKWDGPYVIREVYTNGSYLMVDQDGIKVGPINGHYLKLYYP